MVLKAAPLCPGVATVRTKPTNIPASDQLKRTLQDASILSKIELDSSPTQLIAYTKIQPQTALYA
jgi:hypothetical protein